MLIDKRGTDEAHWQSDARNRVVTGIEQALDFGAEILRSKECALLERVGHAEGGARPSI